MAGDEVFDEEFKDEIADTPRTAEEIARRALALSACIAVAGGDERETNVAWLKREGLYGALSPKEAAFLENAECPERERSNMTWRLECLPVLLWAIRKLPELPGLTDKIDPAPMRAVMVWPPAPTREFIASASLRPEEEIRNAYEVVYESHWKVRDARLGGSPTPVGSLPRRSQPAAESDPPLNGEVIQERHHAFNWVTGYMGQDWDDITTDT